MKKLFFVLSLVTCYLSLVSGVKAEDEVRRLQIDSKAKGYTQTIWQDHLESSNIIFAPNDKFEIQLRIKNDGNRNQTQIHVVATVPSTVTLDMPDFTINQLVPGEEFVRNLVVTVKDQANVAPSLHENFLKFDMKSDVSSDSDTVRFYTNNGTKPIVTPTPVETDINTPTLPATGAAASLILGSGLAMTLLFAGKGLRRLARGY